MAFHERQPAWPRWLPLALETEVDGECLRFRTTRRGKWREVPLHEIGRTEGVRVGFFAWPVGYKMAFSGEETYYVTSGRAVRLHLRSGRILTLGTRDPEGLRRALDGA
ncbi:hypothetical protein [Deinococcus sp. NW-56]|uniref:hypothetical protein n=1 Tax=Deinococcus sp. NW-56 TaxID=2080419 RepID=UPI0018F8A9E1|nr:hypothetical protein [Deinococcus sp. NW-56]